ncbi:MAG: aldo/keto reductase [Candidatus Sumerlaeia bacterium]
MRLRKFGNTGAEVSEIGMGCMRFADPEDIDGMAEVVYRAFEKGVNYFDTAPYYCNDKSEDIVGAAVKEMKKTGKKFYIATKTGTGNGKDVRPQLENSIKRLNVDAIDFYHVWCLVRPGQLEERKTNGVLDAFKKAKEDGLIKHISVSTHLGHDQVGPMLDAADGIFESMLIGLNALNFTMRLPGAQAAYERGMGVVTMNSLGGGMLTDHPSRFNYLKRDQDESIIEPALRFNLSLKEISTALVGFRTVDDVDSAIEAYNKISLLTAEEIEELKKTVLAQSEEFCTQCNYCRDCPEDIPVLKFMQSYNNKILYPDEPKRVLNQLKMHWQIRDIAEVLERCTECRKCERVCTQHLPILQRFEEIKEMARADAS